MGTAALNAILPDMILSKYKEDIYKMRVAVCLETCANYFGTTFTNGYDKIVDLLDGNIEAETRSSEQIKSDIMNKINEGSESN